jgi:hypothetical protein
MAAQRAAAMAQAAAAASTPPGSASGSKPYVCNWVSGEIVLLLINEAPSGLQTIKVIGVKGVSGECES